MNCVNQLFLLGTSGKDPEIRATAGGLTIATFSIATSESRKDAQGNWKDETSWHNIKAFGRIAETNRDQVNKGSKVFIEGKLTTESWDDKQTANHLSVVPNAKEHHYDRTPATPKPNNAVTELTDDDIPW